MKRPTFTLLAIIMGLPAIGAIGISGMTSYLTPHAAITTPGKDGSLGMSEPTANSKMLADLDDYARSVGGGAGQPAARSTEALPDVNTMIDRLAARLANAPGDVEGWRMLGWSYVQTARYTEAAAAYRKAVALNPNSAELKLSYEQARARADSSSRTAAPGADENTTTGRTMGADAVAAHPGDHDAAIRSMVDGLANRLAGAPRDVDGWAHLMRSRVVLGEKDAAVSALRKARDIFKDDAEAARKIAAIASELGIEAR